MTSAMPGAEALEQTLDLLRGPTDERRFVGLLMAAKTLQLGDKAAARQVYEAAGQKFFHRLLLPLSNAQGAAWSQDDLPKAAGACGVGVVVLSRLYCCSDIAQHSAEVAQAPLFLRVVRHGGVLAASGAEAVPQDAQAAEQESVGDALQCLLGLASGGPEGRAAVLQSGALAVLARALASPSPSRSLALRLLILLLDQPSRGALLAGRGPQLAALVAVLARALGDEAAALQRPRQAAEAGARDAAATHLEAMHALQLLLPPPQAAGAELEAAAQAGKAAWLGDARQGLQLLLRGRLAPGQRLGALRLTAAFAQLATPAWLLGAPDGTFLQLLVRLAKIEIILLLRDALCPDERVPAESADGTGSTAGERAAASLPSLLELFEGLLEALGEPGAEDLPARAASLAFGELTEAADALLQFLEAAAAQEQDDPVCLAALRALGRFAAETGGHFAVPRMRKLLPWMAGLQGDEGLPFLLPLLLLATGADNAGSKGLLPAVRSPAVALPLGELVERLAREQGSQAEMHMAATILATLADDLGDSGEGPPHLLQAVGRAARVLAAWVTAANGSLEPSLLVAIGHLIAGAMAAAPGSWAGLEAQQGSQALLLALEVGDGLLLLRASGAAQRQADRLDLSALGASLGVPPGSSAVEEAEEEAREEEARVQSTLALRLATEAAPRLPALRACAAASEWCQEAAARGPARPRTTHSAALEAFCRAVAKHS